nr:hypothetical protein [Tanacetum cinerariifolium]
ERVGSGRGSSGLWRNGAGNTGSHGAGHGGNFRSEQWFLNVGKTGLTRVKMMRKHGYGYLREIEVRRADNDLYTFKEGDFPQLRNNDIE